MTLTFDDHNFGTIEERTAQTMYVVICFICLFPLVTYILKFIIFHKKHKYWQSVAMVTALEVKPTSSMMTNKQILKVQGMH